MSIHASLVNSVTVVSSEILVALGAGSQLWRAPLRRCACSLSGSAAEAHRRHHVTVALATWNRLNRRESFARPLPTSAH